MLLHFPWLELAALIPAIAAIWVARREDADAARRASLIASGLTLASVLAAWCDLALLGVPRAHFAWGEQSPAWFDFLLIDAFNAPLLALAGLLFLLTHLATLRTKVRRFSFARSLAAESILMATFSCADPWGVVLLVLAATVPPWLELRARRAPHRVYLVHMGALAVLLIGGQALVSASGSDGGVMATFGMTLLIAAVLLRSGIAPLHCWVPDLFQHAAFGTSLLYVTPMVGAYTCVRLVLPAAPVWGLRGIALLSLATAVYAAGMALVQRKARRFFAYLLLSHSSLVLVGLDLATPVGLTAALCIWLSAGLCLGGFGLTLRCIEARMGRISLAEFHGMYEQTPLVAAFFLLTGLACIGFPGTVGFVGTELLVDGAVVASPATGAVVVFAMALNGLAVLHAYFRVFNGRRHRASIDLRMRPAERVAIMALTVLIVGGGLVPQPGVASRYRAAQSLIEHRERVARVLPRDIRVATRGGRPVRPPTAQ